MILEQQIWVSRRNVMMDERLDSDNTTPSKKRFNSARLYSAIVTGVLLLMCGISVRIFPMNSAIRILLIATLLSCIFTGLVFLYTGIGRRNAAVWPTVFFAALFIVWAVLGSKPPDINSLRRTYYKRLHAFVGTPYQVNGETTLGIDSAGLARAALWQAMVRQGVKEFNPRLLGTRFWHFWWHDVDAADIDRGKYGYTHLIGHADKLAGFDTDTIKLGDMAIADGRHVMIYCGKGQWIEASEIDGKVVINKAPANSRRKWFNRPVRLIRWCIFDKW